MTELLRMGVRACLGDPRRSFGRNTATYEAVDEAGNVVRRWEEEDATPSLVLDLVHFVDLTDGRRITTEHVGGVTLVTARGITVAALREEIRETIYEDDIRAIDELAHEPRWEEMIETLAAAGVPTTETELEGLPFVVELDDDVESSLDADV